MSGMAAVGKLVSICHNHTWAHTELVLTISLKGGDGSARALTYQVQVGSLGIPSFLTTQVRYLIITHALSKLR